MNDRTSFRGVPRETAGHVLPGATVPQRLLGHDVLIRTRVAGYRFAYGDGATSGAVPAVAWHTYARAGSVPIRADTVVTASFRVDGGGWRELPGTATVRGVGVPLHVFEARAHLVSGPCTGRADVGCG